MLSLPQTEEHQIALEIAKNDLGMQLPIRDLLNKLGLSAQALRALLANDNFKKMVRAYRSELEKDHEGVRLKSAIALEDSIPHLHKIIHDPDTPPNVVVQGCKQLAEMAGLNRSSNDAPTGSGFVVNIDLSGLKNMQNRSSTPIDITPDVTVPTITVSD
jgi:hypothetical protein